ncbi:cadherin-like protein, partial [Ureibacillus xyleni]
INGATSPTFTAPTGTAGTTYYYVVITNTDNSATGNKTATTTSQVATVTINAKSQNANLGALTLSNGTLNRPFDKDITSYTVNVQNAISSITISPIVEDTGKATITVNNQPSITAVPLIVGNNTIQIVVTAEDGVTKRTYTISVNRAQASSSGGGGGYTPTPQPKPPKPEIITAPIEIGDQQGSNVSTATIKRTTDTNGNKKMK